MAGIRKVADLAQKGTVLGLLSVFGYQIYQIGHNLNEYRIDSKYHHTDTFGKINEQIDAEEKLKDGIGQQPDIYSSEDNSYLKKIPDLQKPTK